MNVVMVFSPVVSNENRQLPPRLDGGSTLFEPKDTRRQPNGSVLEARHPISAMGDLTNRPGHDLGLGVEPLSRSRQCSPASGSESASPEPTTTDRRLADQFPLGLAASAPRGGKA